MKTLVADAGGSSTQVQGRRGNENGRKECGVQGVRRFRRPTLPLCFPHQERSRKPSKLGLRKLSHQKGKEGGGHSAMLCDAMKCYTKIAV